MRKTDGSRVSECPLEIATFVNRLGIKGFFEILTSTVAAMTFDAYRDRLDERMLRKRQLRLVT